MAKTLKRLMAESRRNITPEADGIRPYQQMGIDYLRRTPRAYLGDEPGLGKSLQMVRASEGRTLVVAPAMIVDSGTWHTEIGKWADDPSRFHVATFSGLTQYEKTEPRLKPDGTYSRGGSRPTKELLPELKGHWDTVIIDEAHYVKNANALRTNVIRQISKDADRLILASGTPVPNWPEELFVPLQMLRPEDAKKGGVLGSKWRWIDTWFKTAPKRFSDYDYEVQGLRACGPRCQLFDPLHPCEHFREFSRENLGSLFLQRLRDDVLKDLPPMTVQQVEVRMTNKQASQYENMRKQFFAELDDQEVIAWSESARYTFLDRISSGVGIAMPNADILAHSGKLERLEYDLANRTQPTLVASHYRDSVEATALVARKLGLSVCTVHGGTSKQGRLDAVQGFQNGEYDVLCGSIETIAEGLTLTAADMVIMFETSYKPSRNEQAIRRIHRIGQTRPCTVLDYLSVTNRGKITVDGRKRQLLSEKTDAQVRTLSAAQLKELLS